MNLYYITKYVYTKGMIPQIKKEKSTEQLLKEIYKTDRVVLDFNRRVILFLNHNDQSNSAEYQRICEGLREILEAGKN